MKSYLITGGAGFIRANFVKYMLAAYDDIKVIVLDDMTYSGNMQTTDGEKVKPVVALL